MTRETEGETERYWRRYQRELFDGAARLYEATRPGYPQQLAGFAAATAGVGAGSAVLEVGCALTAVDAGASFDLVISGAAFHWVDPAARVIKPACGG